MRSNCKHKNTIEPWQNVELLALDGEQFQIGERLVIRLDAPTQEPIMYTRVEECIDCGHVVGVSMDTETVVTTDKRLMLAIWHTVDDLMKVNKQTSKPKIIQPCPHCANSHGEDCNIPGNCFYCGKSIKPTLANSLRTWHQKMEWAGYDDGYMRRICMSCKYPQSANIHGFGCEWVAASGNEFGDN